MVGVACARVPRRKNTSPATIKLTITREMRRRAERGARRLGLDVAAYCKLALGERLIRDGIPDE